MPVRYAVVNDPANKLHLTAIPVVLAPRVFKRRVLLATFFFGDRDLPGFPINVCNRHRPERYQIDAGHKLGKKRREKFPMPTQKTNENGCDAEIEYVVGR